MPKRSDIKKVMVIGSGPIVIGQAAEFDYAGTQACRSLKEEGMEVCLVNSNPATIMTDKEIADQVYIEPLTVDVLKQIIIKEKPDSLLPTLGGQAGLNLGMELAESGFLEEQGVKLIGTTNRRIIEQNAHKYTQAVIADLADVDEIKELGLGNMDVVIVSMAQDLEASIMCVMVAKENGVHRIIAKAENKRKGEILKKVGATQVIYPERESGIRTAFQLMSRDILQFFDLSSDLVFVEMEPRKEWDGKKISDLELRSKYGINVIAIRRGEKVQTVINLDTVIRKEEPLLTVISKEHLEKLELNT